MSNRRPFGYARPWGRAALPVATILLAIGGVRADDPPVPVDRYGDALDAGALQRLGTVRYQVEGTTSGMAFGPNNRTLLTSSSGAHSPLKWLDGPTGMHIRRSDAENCYVSRLCVSEDRKLLTTLETISTDGRVSYGLLRRRELDTGRVLVEIRVPPNMNMLAASADGSLALTGDRSGKLRAWDMMSGKQLLEQNLAAEVTALAISPAGDLTVAATAGGQSRDVHFWKWREGPGSITSVKVPKAVRALAFSPDGAWLAEGAAGAPGVVVRDALTREQKQLLTVPDESLLYPASLAFSPDGRSLAFSGARRIADHSWELRHCVWDVRTGTVKHSRLKAGMSYGFYSVPLAWSKDGRYLASLADQRRVLVLDTETGRAPNDLIEGHGDAITRLLLTRDGATAITAGNDDRLRIWDVATGRMRHVIRHDSGGIFAAALSPDERWVASSAMDDTLRVCDVATGQEKLRLPGHGNAEGIGVVAFSADGRTLASWGPDFTLRTFDLETGTTIQQRLIGSVQIRDAVKDLPGFRLPAVLNVPGFARNDQSQVYAAALSAYATTLAIVDLSCVVFFDVGTGQPIRALHGEQPLDGRGTLALSPDAKAFAIGSFAKDAGALLRVREANTGKELFVIDSPGRALGFTSSPQGPRVVIAAFQQEGSALFLHDVATGDRLRTIEGLKASPLAAAISADGKRLACGLNDGTALVWDLTVKNSP